MIKGRVGGNLIGWIGALWPNVLKIKKRIGQICSLYNISTPDTSFGSLSLTF